MGGIYCTADPDFENFVDFYVGMVPLKAIETYPLQYLYKVSPDKKTIIALDKNGKTAFAYWRSSFQEFSPSTEEKHHTILAGLS